ncbi:hypothetical protein [Microvirga lenta]|uniref:hypothetical protein n=1 Tax=Microvirga lenta TaxID=2881337 RepID=UPI001CFFA965|nr:hypothetical protein [Microvirga lenta]MCB5176321.1 hypothetical protein [Microvirga lenta]
MFSILRFILIVGAIFYYSPVRERSDMPASLEALLGWSKGGNEDDAEAAPPLTPDRLETVWQALPDRAKQAVIEKILTTSGLGAPAPSGPTDTLQPGERHPSLR